MSEEFRLHVELRAADLVRAGLSPAEARRRARLEFGSAELHKDDGAPGARAAPVRRDARLLRSTSSSAPDAREVPGAHARRRARHRVRGLRWAPATFEFVRQLRWPRHPARRRGARSSASELGRRGGPRRAARAARLRGLARRADDRSRGRRLPLGAAQPDRRPARSASRWRSRRSAPRRSASRASRRCSGARSSSRTSAPARRRSSVIGYDVWRAASASDPRVVGRAVQARRHAGDRRRRDAEGFAFPVAHAAWVPLRLTPLDYGRGAQGPRSHALRAGSPRARRSTRRRRSSRRCTPAHAPTSRATHAQRAPAGRSRARGRSLGISRVAAARPRVDQPSARHAARARLRQRRAAHVRPRRDARRRDRGAHARSARAAAASSTQLFAEALVLGGVGGGRRARGGRRSALRVRASAPSQTS